MKDDPDDKRRRWIDDLFEKFREILENFDIDALKGLDLEDDEFKPIVWGYSINFDSDKKPIFREFGHVPNKDGSFTLDQKTREPLVDIIEDDEIITVILEIPGVEKKDISLSSSETELEIKADRFYKKLNLASPVIPNQANAQYKNGILEVKLNKRRKGNNYNIKVE